MKEEESIRFLQALRSNMRVFGVELSETTLELLSAYRSLLEHWNTRLHLVAPCAVEEFATRHVLESLTLLAHLNEGAIVVDIGSGGGLPIIPCLIARNDLQATLIESSQKKGVFLREALNLVDRAKNASLINRPFEDIESPVASYLTCRALDQFMNKVPALLKWAPAESTLLLFGGEKLREQLQQLGVGYQECLIPLSEKRFLFVVKQREKSNQESEPSGE